jgi:hypothetical protein
MRIESMNYTMIQVVKFLSTINNLDKIRIYSLFEIRSYYK